VEASPSITAHLSQKEIQACFDPMLHLQQLETIYQRLSI